jgi:hypothetical protein
VLSRAEFQEGISAVPLLMIWNRSWLWSTTSSAGDIGANLLRLPWTRDGTLRESPVKVNDDVQEQARRGSSRTAEPRKVREGAGGRISYVLV